MDFFRSQDVARRNTTRLVLLFALALLCLIGITNLLLLAGLGFFAQTIDAPLFQRIDWVLLAWVSGAILVVVAFGSLYKILSLAGGGARVAELLQGRLLLPGSRELREQRILNVVEEMAIAAGTPVPPVYVLDEPGINAFAAGYAPSDAVIGITRGAIETLSRDELQGVIAHEFSHILHGDMRLNIRLIGVLHGILVLGIMGEYLLRSTRHRSRRSKDSGNIAVVGLALLVIGYAGTFFGNLIKAAVSRQREFLADASAVQYTRNPAGIAGALKRIGGSAAGSQLANPAAAEISHALFSEGLSRRFSGLFATHPPLGERIRRIEPDWDGRFDLPAATAPLAEGVSHAAAAAEPLAAEAAANAGQAAALSALAVSAALLAQAGNPREADVQQARQLLASLPPALLQAAHQPASASALVCLLLLDARPEQAAQQEALIADKAAPAVGQALQTLLPAAGAIRPEARLPLLSLALPALRQLSPAQYASLREVLLAQIQSDGRISLWEWVLQRVLVQQLDGVFAPRSRLHHTAHRSLQQLQAEVVVLLGFVLRVGAARAQDAPQQHALPPQAQALFDEVLTGLGLPSAPLPPLEQLRLPPVNAALDALQALKPLQKPAFLKACAALIMADGVAAVAELEIFRALAAALDCPLPPLPATLTASA
jgi:Zn-dependent protease with chaperone function